jgi:hypothetical protein
VYRPQGAKQDQEEGPRRLLVVLLVGVQSVIAGGAATRWPSLGVRASAELLRLLSARGLNVTDG